MSTQRPLSAEHNDKLVPIVATCMERTQDNLEGLTQKTIRFAKTQGFLIERADSEILERSDHAFAVLSVDGEIESRVAFLCPIRLVTTLSALLLTLEESDIVERRNAKELTPDEVDAFNEIGNILAGGLDAALRDSSLMRVHLKFSESGIGKSWNPEEIFDDVDLIHFVAECKPASYESEKIHLIMTRKFVTQITGLEVGVAASSSENFAIQAPQGRALTTLVGIGLEPDEKSIVRDLADTFALEVYFSEDVRNLPFVLVNNDTAGLVIGSKSTLPRPKWVATSTSILKRMRSHPKGKDVPFAFLISWPERDHVSQLAQLGPREIVAMPAEDEIVEKRLERFIRSSIPLQADAM